MSANLGRPLLTESKRQTWVQTERAAHEAWGQMVHKSPRAASLLHTLVAHMDESAAVVCSYAVLCQLSGMSLATVRRAIADLKKDQWIQAVQIGGKGGGLAFLVNSRVAWAAGRDRLPTAAFTARVLASAAEQDSDTLNGPPLRRVPVLQAGEVQLPMGDGLDPPNQPELGGVDLDLPSVQSVDPESGEMSNPFLNLTSEQIALERGRIFQLGINATR